MQVEPAILLNRSDLQQLLTLRECIDAVENVFRLQGEGKLSPPGILGIHSRNGGLHVKAGVLAREKNYIVAKLNTNFPNNRSRFGLPTIQGLIIICDADNGRPLALIDSIEITIQRTAAATAVAAKYLARKNSKVATICGCGQQGRAQLRALHLVLPLTKVYVFDVDFDAAARLATELSLELRIEIEPVRALPRALRESDVCVTCTTATKFFLRQEDIAPGTFIAAVGADDAHKQEIEPTLIASNKVVADNLDQVCTIGDTHHAIAQGLMSKKSVHAELGEIVVGKKPGRTTDNEIFIFDSTGVASEDAAAAAAVYEKAVAEKIGECFNFAA